MAKKSTVPSRRWGTRETSIAEFGITRDQLLDWADTGVVRTCKFANGTQQGRRVFCMDDIAAALERIAVGLEPEIRRR